MQQRSKMCGALGLLALSGVAMAQPANDNWADARAVSGVGTAFDTDNVGAVTDGPSNCGLMASDVWFCWTASADGSVSATTCNGVGYDSVISVYDGCGDPATLATLGCNDDSCGLQSRVLFTAVAGRSYLVQIGGFNGAMGTGTWQVADPNAPLVSVTNPANGHRYTMHTGRTWTEAEALAVSLGGHLVTINDAAENEFVRASVLGFDGVDRRGWIGFNDVASEGNFVWSSGEAASFTNWNGGEPNNANGTEHYTEMLGGSGAWNDQPDGGNGFGQVPIIEYGVTCIADVDDGSGTGTPDGGVTIDDLLYYLGLFADGNIRADVDNGTFTGTPDGGVTIDDLLYFLSRYADGC